MRRIHKTFALSFAIIALILAATACTHRKTVEIGSHKVTVGRHGFEKKFVYDPNATVPSFEYAGVSTDGHGLKVSIKGDMVNINGEDAGQLRPGDSVYIGDDGVAVNNLDYGQSAKYLRENGSATQTSALR